MLCSLTLLPSADTSKALIGDDLWTVAVSKRGSKTDVKDNTVAKKATGLSPKVLEGSAKMS